MSGIGNFFKGLTPLGKLLIAAVIAGMFLGAWKMDILKLPGTQVHETRTVKKSNLPTGDLTETADSRSLKELSLPSKNALQPDTAYARIYVWEWGVYNGAFYANGGPFTTEGSLVAKQGAQVQFVRQDDNGKMQDALLAAADALSKGHPIPEDGATHVIIMGPGSEAFIRGADSLLSRLGNEYTLEVIGSTGYSRGEDKCMGPKEWADDPQKMRGGTIIAVLRDGDHALCLKKAADNDIPVNPDEATYNPDALNFINAPDYLKAVDMYVAGTCQTRKEVKADPKTGKTKLTGKKVKVCGDGVATWTPGDVNEAQQKGGLVSLASTLEYKYFMPSVILGIRKWDSSHRPLVEGMLSAFLDGGDQVKHFPKALSFAAQVARDVYDDKDAEYWEKYFKGFTETDAAGVEIRLGGSAVNNLADNLFLFGLAPYRLNRFKQVYDYVGEVIVDQYPDIMPSFENADKVFNPSYLLAISRKSNATTGADISTFSASSEITNTVSKKSWHVEFESGKDTFTPAALQELRKILGSTSSTGLYITVNGYTDDVGSDDVNVPLSKRRAQAVQRWLSSQSPADYPDSRFRTNGFGSGRLTPQGSKSLSEWRAENRRVEIILGN